MSTKSQRGPRSKTLSRREAAQLVSGALLGLAPLRSFGTVYLTPDKARSLIFPGETFTQLNLNLIPKQAKEIQRRSGIRVRERALEVWRSPAGNVVFSDRVLGKHEFITYMCGITADGAVKQIEILEYWETYGDESAMVVGAPSSSASAPQIRSSSTKTFVTSPVRRSRADTSPTGSSGCSPRLKSRSGTMRRAQPWLGTLVEIEAQGDDETATLSAIDAAFATITCVHRLMSRQLPGSDVHRINVAAVGQDIVVHPWTARVLDYARGISKASQGAFDVVMPGPARPSPATWRDLTLVRRSSSAHRFVRKRRPMKISLDGIAKGFAVDQAVRVLRNCGMRAGVVNAGGDLRCFGSQPSRVAIRGPDPVLPAPMVAFDVCNRAVATSSPAFGAKFWGKMDAAGNRRRGRMGITVIAHSAMLADAMTKALRCEPANAGKLFARYRAQAWSVRGAQWTRLDRSGGK